MGPNSLARRDGIRDGIDPRKEIEDNMGGIVSKEAGKDAAHELAAGGRDAAQEFARGCKELGKDAVQELARGGREAVQAITSAMKFCVVVVCTVFILQILAPILQEWVKSKGRGSCDG